MRFNKGFSMIEIIMYVGLLGGVAVFMGNFLIHTVSVYQRTVAERDVISNGRLLLETVSKNVSEAKEVYAPTSVFNANGGQLTIVTEATSTPQHDSSYMDFWIDNGLFLTKREGQATTTLSASSVRVTKFYIERIVQGLGREAVKITIQVDSASKYPASATVNATAALRGNY